MQITVEIELEQRRWSIGRPARQRATCLGKAEGVQLEGGHEGVQEAHGVCTADIIVERFGEEQRLGPIQPGTMFHPCQTYGLARCSMPCRTFHTASHYSERGGAYVVFRFD